MLLLLTGVLLLLLGQAFLPGRTLFSNDGPLGRLVSECHSLPDSFTGVWEDLNSIGYREQGALPNLSWGLRWVLHPLLYSKSYAFLALFLLGWSAWLFFKEWGFSAPACVLGGLAMALNNNFFSTASWGIAAHPLSVATSLLAFTALAETTGWRGWLRTALAGLAVGLGVSEAADVGAIFSIFVAAFIVWQAATESGPALPRLSRGGGRLIVVSSLALLLAAQAIFALVGTQIEGVAGTQQDENTREHRWNWATQWSLPRREALSLVVPGLFGFRMDTPQGGNYWGELGRDAAWTKYLADGAEGPPPRGLLRQTGSGIYTGVPVVLIALWAGAQALRRKNSIFTPLHRRWIWFWSGSALLALALGLGHNAPFYGWLYHLPYFSTIRNPIKFIDIVSLALVVLFAYGVDGLWRTYLTPALSRSASGRGPSNAQRWPAFDRGWLIALFILLGLSVVAWVVYSNSRESLVKYLLSVQFKPGDAGSIADFSVNQVGWFVLLLTAAITLFALFAAGVFRGSNARWGLISLGGLLIFDLCVADRPFVIFWDYKEKYATNPVIDLLKTKPEENRVAILPSSGPAQGQILTSLYKYEWAQHQFQYYNIQSLDVVQLPRVPEDLQAYQKVLVFRGTTETAPNLIRRWQLTNTRLLLGPAPFLTSLNGELDPQQKRFQIALRFNIVPRPGVVSPHTGSDFTAVPDPNGQFAVFSFSGALPRTQLCGNWETLGNDDEALHRLTNSAFDPLVQTLVSGDKAPKVSAPTNASPNGGSVVITRYLSRHVTLEADAKSPCVLQLNDRYDPNWKVRVDGQPADLFRCNYIMRGVYLAPGHHHVQFDFEPPVGALYVSLIGIAVGAVLLGVFLFTRAKTKAVAPGKGRPPAKSPTENPPTRKPASAGSGK